MVRISNKHRFAIELRYLGKKYEDISVKTGIGTKTLYKYFCKGGMLFEPYRNYEAEMNEEALRNAKGQLKRHSEEATNVLVKGLSHIKTNPNIAIKAAMHILNLCDIANTKNESDGKDMATKLLDYYEMGLEAGSATVKTS